ncbi:MAG: aldehyde dehydrogenase [Gemmobacter sp.]
MTRAVRPRAGLVAAALLAAALAAAPAAAYDEPEDLPEGEGRDDTFWLCSACHSFQVVARQGMSRGMWDDTLTLMVERHGMPELDAEERTLILDYLAEHFGPDLRPARGGWQNPFAPRN